MRDFELDLGSRTGGGGARGGGSFYHVSFRSGSRAGGACARSAYDYITREREYEDDDRDPAIFTESGNMPSWAQEDPGEYWDAADSYERVNGRLFVSADFALPRDLDQEDQIQLARDFVSELTDDERLPYTFAIHAGEGSDRQEHNPHVHVMVSERRNDGIERDASDWFRRANREEPGRGGAPKSREFHGREWVEKAREKLAELLNDKLRELGREDESVDHRSYDRQGLDLEPGEHFGPEAAHQLEGGYEQDRLGTASGDDQVRLVEVDRQIDRLQQVRDLLFIEISREAEMSQDDRQRRQSWCGPSRDDDSRGR